MHALALSPHGVLHLDPDTVEAGAPIPEPVERRIAEAFSSGPAFGLLHLGVVETTQFLPPTYAFFRDLARDTISTLRAEPGLESLRDEIELTPQSERLEALVRAVPPMRGAEYLTPAVLEHLWKDVEAAFKVDIARYRGTVAAWLHEQNPAWTLVGRVYFHLAENKDSDETPFAFLATYTAHVGRPNQKLQHRQLGKAVAESASARDRESLRALLVPVQRAAEKSALVKALVENGDIYHPLAWTPEQALAFLNEVPALEESGVVVRIPNWWSHKNPPRPQVRVTVGKGPPSLFGVDALVDFSVDVTLGGQKLTEAELYTLLQGGSGLRFVKGQWVDVDDKKLGAVLEHWKTAQREAGQGLSFLDSMRLLAGTSEPGDLGPIPEDTRAWTRVEAGAWLDEVLEGLRSPEGLAAADPGRALHAELRPYQQVGVRWLWWLQRIGLSGCLADDMGLGKTIQVLSLLLLLRRESGPRPPSLLIVPASLVGNWLAEAERFAPSLVVRVAHGSAARQLDPADLAGVDLVLTTYGTLLRAKGMLTIPWNVLVIDEAQAIKNPGARQTRQVKALNSRTRLALTGTPIENRLGDLWSLFDFLTPGLLGGAKDFGRLASAASKRSGGAYGPLRALVSPYILRRLKTDKTVISDLPDKTELRTFCHLTPVQAALYSEAVEDLKRVLAGKNEGIERKGYVLAALMRFKQICNHPSQWLGDGLWDPQASGKLERLRELCDEIAARQEKVLVFTQFREMTEPLAQFLQGVFGRPGLVLHGGTPVKARKKLVDEFQTELGPPFFVLSLKAGGTGLNLTAASHVVHFDRWWNPAVEDQATDRAFRIGQKKNVLVHKLVCRGTLEERIDELITSKKGLAGQILQAGAETALTEMSNDELLRMVSLDLQTAVAEAR